jgi:hypothetical protein
MGGRVTSSVIVWLAVEAGRLMLLVTVSVKVETWVGHVPDDCVEDAAEETVEDAVEAGGDELLLMDWLEVPNVVLRKH